MKDINTVPLPSDENWQFVDELRQPERFLFSWTRTQANAGEADLHAGVTISEAFPDPKGRLVTAYDDLKKFFAAGRIGTQGMYRIVTETGDAGPYDSFRLIIAPDHCRIIAKNTEGIRRGIFYLEELLSSSDGPFLKTGEIRRDAWLKNRISRCFFGPIKRPPMNRDELADEIDYYPDAYLNRLAHEGINGLWLTVEFKDLCRTEFTPEYGKDAEKRLAKLQRTVQQCLRYGIKTYIFTIEPAAWKTDDPVLKQFPELGGARFSGNIPCFCPSSEKAEKYLYECTHYIFSHVPELGGMINISLGERTTTCLTTLKQLGHPEEKRIDCPRCGKILPEDVIYNAVSGMVKGMLSASPDAEFICWYYMPIPQDLVDWAFRLTRLPEHTVLMFNFESGGRQVQLGKERVSGDYWLSYDGPSDNFKRMAAAAKKAGVPMGAKLQCACSHELATVPYIPVPGQLYRKYKQMKELGVNSAMQCWYFGNYPGLMNRASGMLAFEDFKTDELDFLNRLAKPQWGNSAGQWAKIWQKTSEAYRNFPFSNAMQYYGPFHNGIVWPLYPTKQYKPLSPTWQLNYPVSGDTIGECLENHTLQEASELCRRMAEQWHEAAEMAFALREQYAAVPERLRDIDLMDALDLLFTAGSDTLRFYLLRAENNSFTPEMRSIMEREITLTERMIELCRKDSRLGFHSEAENYEFYPERLAARAEILREFLKNPPLPVKFPELQLDQTYHADTFSWSMHIEKDELKIKAEFEGRVHTDQVFVTLLGRIEDPPILLDFKKGYDFFPYPSAEGVSFRILECEENHWTAELSVSLERLHADDEGFRISLIRFMQGGGPSRFDSSPKLEKIMGWRLCVGFYDPSKMYLVKR